MTFSTTQAFVVALATIPAGLVVGLIYFRAMRTTIDLFAKGHGWRPALCLSLVRFAGLVGVLSFAAQLGAMALIGCFLGFLLARAIALRSVSEAR